MLSSLRHDRLVGRNAEERYINAEGTDQHVRNELLVPRDIDNRHASDRRQVHEGEPDIDRHSTTLFFRQSVGIDAG